MPRENARTAGETLAGARRRIRRASTALAGNDAQPPKPPTIGVVETFNRRRVTGWVSVPADAPPTRVRLCLNNTEATATYATAQPDETSEQTARHGWQQVRHFSFRISDVWRFAGNNVKLSVRVGRHPLPISGHGLYRRADDPGKEDPAQLRAKLADGYVFAQDGKLQRSKKLDRVWQLQVLDLYERVRTIVREAHGYDVFVVYGTLLGLVREGGVIAHDVDFDAAFVSGRTDGRVSAQELAKVAETLTSHGLDAQLMWTAIHVHDLVDPDVRIDLFHLFFDDAGQIQFPFGVAGTSSYTTDDWKGVAETDFLGRRVAAPVAAEKLVEHIYGPDWREPKPGFNWSRDRTAMARYGRVTHVMHARSHWANFYAHHREPEPGSSFAEAIQARPDTPETIVDLGCGNGRDSLFFLAAGHRVVGIDAADSAIAAAREHAAASPAADRADFRVVDVSDAEALRATLADVVAGADGEPIMCYLRFFLHAITEEIQGKLLVAIDETARAGDLFAAEFRTTEDKERAKSHGRHFRRYQDGPAFGALLRDTYRYTLLDETEGTGIAPWGDEDPYLYRVIARHG